MSDWRLSAGGGYLVHEDGTEVVARDILDRIAELEAELATARACVDLSPAAELVAARRVVDAWSKHKGTRSKIPGPDTIDVTYTGEQWDKILKARRELADFDAAQEQGGGDE